MEYARDILANVLANVIFWLGLGVAVWSWSTRTRRRFLAFFGLRNDAAAPTVYVSNLWTPNSDIAPRPAARSKGYTISLHEFRAVQAINRLFGAAPLRLPDLTRGLIDNLWIRTVGQPPILVAPPDVDAATVVSDAIVIGSSVRNSVRRALHATHVPLLAFDTEVDRPGTSDTTAPRYLVVQRGPDRGLRISSHLNLAIVERIQVSPGRHTVFFCAGVKADTSFAATEYLVRHWSRLEREFRGRDLALALGFPAGAAYMENYAEPQELWRPRA